MSQREEEADPDRLVPLLKKLASGVVDGRDVIRIERVAQSKCVRKAAKGQEARVLGAIRKKEAPPEHVKQGDGPEETAQAGTLTRIEGAPDQGPG